MTDKNSPFIADSHAPNPAPSWPFSLFGQGAEDEEQAQPAAHPMARPSMVSDDDGARQAAAGHGLAGSAPVEQAVNPFLQPDDRARLDVPEHEEQAWQGAATQITDQGDLKPSEDVPQQEEMRPESEAFMRLDKDAAWRDDVPSVITGQGAAGHKEVTEEKDGDERVVDTVVGEQLLTPAPEKFTPKISDEPVLSEVMSVPKEAFDTVQPEKTMQPKPEQRNILPQTRPVEAKPENHADIVEEKPTPQNVGSDSNLKQTGVEVELTTSSLSKPKQAKPADLVTVEEAVEIFQKRGLPRHMRTIQKYCAKKNGQALVCHQMPTENGIRYMIERSSILRFISDAAQQTPTGKLDAEPVSQTVKQTIAQSEHLQPPQPTATLQAKSETHATSSVAEDVTIFDHPFVKRLEKQVEKLESRNEDLQTKIQDVLVGANERLAELQKASAVAQSESLGKFLLESERIRNRQEDDEQKKSTVLHSPSAQFGQFNV